jgi:hypothetical protein
MSTLSISPKFADRDRPGDDQAVRRSLPLQLSVAIHRDALTRGLATGMYPAASPELLLRAAQLSSPHHRRQLAKTWRRTVKEARQPALSFAYTTLIQRRAVIEADDAIRALIARLNSNEPVAAQGMAILYLLMTDGSSSPLYLRAEPGTLRRQLIMATEAMDPQLAELSLN